MAVSMRRKDCAVGRETDSVSELLYGGRFTAQISSMNTIPDIQWIGRDPSLKSLRASHILGWIVVSVFVVCLLLRFIVLMLKLINVKRWRFVR